MPTVNVQLIGAAAAWVHNTDDEEEQIFRNQPVTVDKDWWDSTPSDFKGLFRLPDEVSELGDRLSTVEELGSLATDEELASAAGSLSSRLTALETVDAASRLTTVETGLGTVDGRIDTLEGFNAGTRLGALETAIAANTELAFAENRTGVNVTETGTTVRKDITGLAIAVPASTRPVYIGVAVLLGITTAASVTVFVTEVSNGVDTPIERTRAYYLTANFLFSFDFDIRLGPTDRTRNFKISMMKSAGGTLTCYVGDNAAAKWDCYVNATAR